MASADKGDRKRAATARRLPPDARRRQIIATTRQLLIERPGEPLSTADVAEASGVTRALVHHYFKGIEDLLDAVTLTISEDTPAILSRGPETPIAERVRANISSFLDVVEANRHVWLASLAEGARPVPTRSTDRVRDTVIAQMLANNTDVISDTPWARLCLTGYFGFSDILCRQWLLGRAKRSSVENALVATLQRLLLDVIPAGETADGTNRSTYPRA